MRVERVTLYADRKSGYECLLAELSLGRGSALVGAAYDPRSTAAPTPFHSECPHCLGGFAFQRRSPLPIQVKRLVQTLLSRRTAGFVPQHRAWIYEYSVPTNGSHCRLRCWQTPAGKRLEATDPGERTASVTLEPDGELRLGGEIVLGDAKILGRAVKFMLSERVPSANEVRAVLGSLPQVPSTHWRANPCRSISWREVLELALRKTTLVGTMFR